MTSDSPPCLPNLPVDWVRTQFPALAHSGALLDNAGGSATLGRVVDRVSEYMSRWPVQLGATYRESAVASDKLLEARRAIAGLLGTDGHEAAVEDRIVIGASTSSLLSRLARSLAPSLEAGVDVIVTNVDHEANITPWKRLAQTGVNILTWTLNRDSQRLEIDDLRGLLSERTRLVCFTHASNILGQFGTSPHWSTRTGARSWWTGSPMPRTGLYECMTGTWISTLSASTRSMDPIAPCSTAEPRKWTR